MSERLFFALWPQDDQRRMLTRIQRELPAHGGRRVHRLDIHVTLVFLGSATTQQRACAEKAAEGVRSAPFELVLDHIGFFPGSRVLWCGADVCPRPLEDLVASLAHRLEACGFIPERRPYLPHATLLRKSVVPEQRTLGQPIRWPADGFVLACSQGGAPPRYRILRRWHFKPETAES